MNPTTHQWVVGSQSLQKIPTARAWYFAFPNLSLLLLLRRFPQGLYFLLDPSNTRLTLSSPE